MYKLKYTTTFKKSYKRIKKRGLDIKILKNVIETLRQGKSLDARFKVHQLKGNFSGYYECHLKPDWLLIYLIEDDILTLTLINTGSHSDLFKK